METDDVENARGPDAVRAEGLVKHYKGRGGMVEAVRGVDLHVRSGEVFGFLGPNGAGKSTTVRMLTTLLTITDGTASVAGIDVAQDPDGVRRLIGVALQEAGLDPRQSGRELLILQGRLFGMSTAEAAERAEQLLALVELEDAADRRIKGYSGGMKRRLDLASALVHEPEVLFLDEPTTGLDPSEPADGVGRGAADQRARDHGVPHREVPRGGRPAVRSPGDHRRRPDRPPGHACRAEGRPARAPRPDHRPHARRRSAAATNSGGLIFFPLLFLTPNFVPRDMLTHPMEVAATLNPVTYIMEALRSLILQDLVWSKIWPGFLVVAVLGAIMLALNVRTINSYD